MQYTAQWLSLSNPCKFIRGFMPFVTSLLPATRLLSLKPLAGACLAFCLLATGSAWADDYTDINRLLRAGQLAEAAAKADAFLASKPRDAQMRFLKGVILTEQSKPNDAIGTFTKLTEDYPELPEPYNNLAVLYAGQSQFDKARAALEMAIRTNPSYATAHENLGDVYAKLASQAYSKALQLDNSNTGVQPKLALIRDLFGSPGAKASRPVAVAAANPTPAPAAAVATPTAKPTAAAVPTTAPATPAAPATAAASDNADKDVRAAVQAWASAWSAKNTSGYLAAYGNEFDAPGGRKSWEEERKKRIVSKNKISVKLSDLNIKVTGNKAQARFRQDYDADALSISSRKTLDMVKSGDRWVIVKESTGN
jgi:tetratricopeptide (TPR) repeat protein